MNTDAYHSLRQWFYRFCRKHQREEKKPISYLPGLPESLEPSRFAAVFQEHFQDKLDSVSHTHLSGWKSSGAYRLKINTGSEKEINLIYKNAVYQQSEIPALVDFPLIPGPPEYTVLSQAAGPLAEYLPRVYLVEDVEPGKHYRYLLEDLQQNYHVIKGDADKMLVLPLITQLHQALADWKQHSFDTQLLQYGSTFSAALQNYARIRLEQYQQYADHDALHFVLLEWQQIARLHLEPEFFSQPVQLIHGDSNYTNIHLSKQGPPKIKVVDWEWAGFASPYADLASLIKGSITVVEKKAFQLFCEARGECQPQEGKTGETKRRWRHYQWCVLERGMMDAAFLSAQYLNAPNQARFSLPNAIASSLRRMRNSYRQLAG